MVTLLSPVSARAQAASGSSEPEPQPREHVWALGLGAGIVQPDGGSETYWSANLRRRVRKTEGQGGAQGAGQQAPEGLKAFLEAEVGYWKGSTLTTEDKDLLLGVNLIGAVPTRSADIFIGVGFGAHFTDATLVRPAGGRSTVSDTRLGGNLQFGVEVRMSERTGLFGAGRIDFLSGSDRNRQLSKVWGGLRVRF
jgi:hypothetical protein